MYGTITMHILLFMSSIEYDAQHLSPVDYRELLESIQAEMQKQTQTKEAGKGKDYLFLSSNPYTLTFDIDAIADAVAKTFANSDHYPFEPRDGLKYASIHTLEVDDKKEFSQCLRETVFREVRTQLAKRMGKSVGHRSLSTHAQNLLTPINAFIKEYASGLSYPIDRKHSLEKRNLHASNEKGQADLWLKAHKLTLTVSNITSFTPQIVQSITEYIEQYNGCDEDDIADVRENLANAEMQPKSNLNQLKDIIIKDSVARIHREARVAYLEYIRESMKVGLHTIYKQVKKETVDNVQSSIRFLTNLIERVHQLDEYVRTSDKAYSEYTVFFRQDQYNLRDILSRVDALNPLPIIGEIDGFLGETTDQQRQSKTFTSGVKIKLNGPVHNHGGGGKPVFDFNTVLLDPTSPQFQTRAQAAKRKTTFGEKVVRIAVLYCFVFVEMENPQFQPISYFEEYLLPALRSNDETRLNTALKQLKEVVAHPSVIENLKILRDAIVDFLKRTSTDPVQSPYSGALTLDKSILTKDVNQIIQGNFFQDVFDSRNGKNALKYIAITKNVPSSETLSKLSLTMTFEPIYYFPTDQEPNLFMMSTYTEGIQVLPTFLCPVDQDAPSRYGSVYKHIRRIAFYYRHHAVDGKSAHAFVYRFTYTLLAYTMIKLFAESLPEKQRNLFFAPIICLHAQKEQALDEKSDKYDDETFMHSLSKQLAHMLSEDYISGSQGFFLDTVQKKNYNLSNALYSLYSSLPHKFETTHGASTSPAHNLKKLAVIVVTSRKSDENTKDAENYLSNLIGKVIGIERNKDNSVMVRTLNTFSANQHSKDLYRNPSIIIEQVKKYHRQGYEHFLYVARAPYSSTLNVSDANGEDLYFMNKDVIRAMRSIDSRIKIYPAFCDKYFVIDHHKTGQKKQELLRADSLYIDDVGELTAVSNDPSRRSQIFLNLFNGITVNPEAVYTGVMSYSTLINVYADDPTYDQYIWNDLLNTSVPNSMKAEILDFIALLHFSRYEKASQKENPVGFKLDPYTDIIGDDGVGAQSIFPHMNGRAWFNSLAFLTVVRAVMHTKKSLEEGK